MYLTIDEIIKANPPKNLNDDLLNEMESYGMPEIPTDSNNVKSLYDSNNCENWNLSALKSSISSIKQEAKNAAIQAKQTIEAEIDALVNTIGNYIENIKKLWTEIKDKCVEIYKKIISTYNSVINYFKGEFQRLINIWKRIKNILTSKEEKIKLKNELISTLKKYGKDVLEMFGIFIIVDAIKSIWAVLKNIWGISRNGWRNFIKTFNETDEMLDDESLKTERLNSLISMIKSILPLIGLIGVMILSFMDCKAAESELSVKALDIEQKNSNNNSNINNSSQSILLNGDINLNIDNNDNNDPNKKSSISICPVDDILSYDIFTDEGTIIEIGSDIQDFVLNINNDQDIKHDDIIGNINNIPIKSIVEGKVIYKSDRYAILKNNSDESNLINRIEDIGNIIAENQSNFISTGKSTPEIDNISDSLKDMNNIEFIFMNYLKFLYKSIINSNVYNYTKTNPIIKNIENDVRTAETNHDNIIDTFNNTIQSICNADYVKGLAENNQLNIIKDKIIDEKLKLINYIYDNINEYYKIDNRNVYEIKNYNMCDYYINFLIQDIDMNNTHLVKLYELIKSLYIKRFNFESKDINILIKKFDNILKENNIKNKSYSVIYKINGVLTYDKIYEYFDIIIGTNDKNDIKNKLANLYILINDIKNYKISTDTEIDFKKLSYEESHKIKNIIDEFYNIYKNSLSTLNNINNLFNFVNWPQPGEIYIDNKKYKHYIFTDTDSNNTNSNKINATDEELNDDFNGKTEYEMSSTEYWLKYCAMATVVNCTLPIYWGTGLVIAGAPVPLPIILIPIKYVQAGDIGVVIGLGICGIAIWPMILLVNWTFDTQTVLIPINILLAQVKKMVNDVKNAQFNSIKSAIDPMILALEEKIKNTKADIKLLDNEILTLKSMNV